METLLGTTLSRLSKKLFCSPNDQDPYHCCSNDECKSKTFLDGEKREICSFKNVSQI